MQILKKMTKKVIKTTLLKKPQDRINSNTMDFILYQILQ